MGRRTLAALVTNLPGRLPVVAQLGTAATERMAVAYPAFPTLGHAAAVEGVHRADRGRVVAEVGSEVGHVRRSHPIRLALDGLHCNVLPCEGEHLGRGVEVGDVRLGLGLRADEPLVSAALGAARVRPGVVPAAPGLGAAQEHALRVAAVPRRALRRVTAVAPRVRQQAVRALRVDKGGAVPFRHLVRVLAGGRRAVRLLAAHLVGHALAGPGPPGAYEHVDVVGDCAAFGPGCALAHLDLREAADVGERAGRLGGLGE